MNINESAKLQKESTPHRFQSVLAKNVNPAHTGPSQVKQSQVKPSKPRSKPYHKLEQIKSRHSTKQPG